MEYDEFEGQLWKKYLAEIIGSAPKEILDVGTGTGGNCNHPR